MIKKNVRLLKKEIENSELYKEYVFLKSQISSSEEIATLKKEINIAKQNMTNHINNAELHAQYKNEYQAKLDKYENHPLIQNFNYIKEELGNELNLIKEQINP